MNFRLVEETLFVRERNLKTFIWWKMKLKTFLRLKPVLKIASIADLQNCFKNTLNKFTNLSSWIFQCWWSMFRPKYTADRCHQHHWKIQQCFITITSILVTTFIVCHAGGVFTILVTNFVTNLVTSLTCYYFRRSKRQTNVLNLSSKFNFMSKF